MPEAVANVSPRYSHIDFTPSAAMQHEAEQGLDWWRAYAGRGGNEMALARAWRIRRTAPLSPDVIRRMVSHMARLEERKIARGWNEQDADYPCHSRVTWSLMGGDAGYAWARAIVEQMNRADAELVPNQRAGVLAGNVVTERDGKIVVPVVALVPGVVNGMLVTAEELSRNVQAWNGRPVTLRHPRIGQQYVTANDPAIAERQQLGVLYNVDFSDGKLKGEIWLDPEACARVGSEGMAVLQGLETGNPYEVSTGYYCDVLDQAGTFNGQAFDGVQVDLRPDHLAILPDELGACSWADGCGTPRVNSTLVVNSLQTNEGPDYSGDAMVAFYLRDQAGAYSAHVGEWPEGAQALAAEEYHVTLAYLGKVDEMPEYNTVARAVSEFARFYPSMFARVSGSGRFSAEPEEPQAVYLSIDSRELQTMRAELVSYLEAFGVPVSHKHGFTPHITLGYVPAGVPLALSAPVPSHLAVDDIALAWGNNVTLFPLQGQTYAPETVANNEEDLEVNTCTCKENQNMSEENTAPVTNDAAQSQTLPPDVQAQYERMQAGVGVDAELEIEVTPSDADRLVDEFGGLAAVRAMLEQFQANTRAEQDELLSRVVGNARCAFSADELRAMPLDVLRKLDASLRPADYSLRPAANSKADNAMTMYGQSWTPYQAPAETESK